MTESGEGWVQVARVLDIEERYPLRVLVGEQDIALVRKGEDVFAIANLCSHAYAFLSDGYVEDGDIFCPLHDGSFDIRTGEARNPPCVEAVATFPVRVKEGAVFVNTGDAR